MRNLFMAVLLVSGAALAADVEVSDCVIQEVMPGMDMTGAFVTLDNETDQPVVLKKASVDSVSQHVELHKMAHENGVMVMEEMPEYVLKPGKSQFKKGGNHIMIMDIAEAPEVGSEHEMTFEFANGDKGVCLAAVKSVADVTALYGDAQGEHHHHDDANMEHKHGTMKMEHDHNHGGMDMKHDHSAQ